jgi:hypothetical protein
MLLNNSTIAKGGSKIRISNRKAPFCPARIGIWDHPKLKDIGFTNTSFLKE